MFGAFVALALWLPQYLINVYGVDIKTAGMVAAMFSLPASVFRAYGGHLSDRYGARRVMYWTFLVGVACTFVLSYPPTDYIVKHDQRPRSRFHLEMGVVPFTVIVFVLGFFMALGQGRRLQAHPGLLSEQCRRRRWPGRNDRRSRRLRAPDCVRRAQRPHRAVDQLLHAAVPAGDGVALIWMHFSRFARWSRALSAGARETSAVAGIAGNPQARAHVGALSGAVLTDWRPEDKKFWDTTGRAIARRNLWVSIPALLLSFAVWQVWSVVVAKLPSVGFNFTTDQLFWLAALPGISGAVLRIFYSFMVPIFGGRLWTTLATWSLMIPAVGIGYAVQNPNTPYFLFLALALLCGFGGGNFASSMSNISFFFPRSEKGNALALNAGLGNLGVSVVQFVVPIIITVGVFGWFGGDPTMVKGPAGSAPLWLQNAGFIWVPFIAASAFAAWFGMNDIASAKASFSEQAVIFQRKHNWLMCWLYTGTFGSFIGYSAGFPLLAKTQFPAVDALPFVFLGPLVGALSRSATGWISDRWGGARVTIVVFLMMMAGVAGVLYFLGIKDQPNAFWGFFAMFLLLFFATGVGNASTFQMIPNIMRTEIARLMPKLARDEQLRQAEKESAAITGFTSAIAAFGAFFIPKSYGSSIALTGGVEAALWGFLIFYVSCLAITWWFYTRRGGLLYDVERRTTSRRITTAAAPAE